MKYKKYRVDVSREDKALKKGNSDTLVFAVPLTLETIQDINGFVDYEKSIHLNGQELLGKALRLHAAGQILEAEKTYLRFFNLGLIDPRALSNYGVICKQHGEINKAIDSYRTSIRLFPNSPEAYSNLASILRDLGQLKEAEDLARIAIRIKPDYEQAHLNLGFILKDLGKIKEAELFTRNALNLRSNFNEALSNLSGILFDIGELVEAEKYIRKAISIKPRYSPYYSNLSAILIISGKLKEAERYARKSIKLNKNFAEAHLNLANILKDSGKFKEAELSILKAIQLKSDFANAYFLLSTMKTSLKNLSWQDKIFSEDILMNQTEKNKVDIYFARANILHNKKDFTRSSKNLIYANEIKSKLDKSNIKTLIDKSKYLLSESNYCNKNKSKGLTANNHVFIVGMPRCGSTLVESILSMNKNVTDLGENNIFEESFLQWKNSENTNIGLEEIYNSKIKNLKLSSKLTTNKWLYNYQYSGIINSQFKNSKIIHCFRNPLDNLLSIYRANFSRGNQYSSSLKESAIVYLDQDMVMAEYKKRYRSNIYDLNYDLLVTNPYYEIKRLILWLGWKWDEIYLFPHLNKRVVLTASSVQVRSPINANSLGGWKNYSKMLKPAIDLILRNEKYRDILN